MAINKRTLAKVNRDIAKHPEKYDDNDGPNNLVGRAVISKNAPQWAKDLLAAQQRD